MKLLHFLSIFSLLLLTTTVSARPGRPFHPCNTLIISTYSFSLHQNNPSNPNPNTLPFHGLRPLVGFRLPRHPRLFLFPAPGRTEINLPRLEKIDLDRSQMTDLPLVGLSSFKDRTKDILSVVASLLFGAACGALTAGTMYLIWSLLTYRSGYYRSLDGFATSDDDDDDDDYNNADSDVFNPKKSHQNYVPIPASPVKEKKVNDTADVAVAKETV